MELYLSRRLRIDDERQWVRFPKEGSLTIGRSANCDLRLSSIHVSRNHAMLKRSADGFLVKDLNSLLGTLVNNIKISSENWYTLKSGDEIEFGRLEEEGNNSENMKLDARFVYLIKQDSSDVLDEKPRGPSCHASAAFKKILASSLKRKLAPSNAKHACLKNSPGNSTSLLQESDLVRENKRLKLVLDKKELVAENSKIAKNEKLEDPVDVQRDFVSEVPTSVQVTDPHLEKHENNLKRDNSDKNKFLKNLVDVQKDFVISPITLNSGNHGDLPVYEKVTEILPHLGKKVKNSQKEGERKEVFTIESLTFASTSAGNAKISNHGRENDNKAKRDLKAMEQENERLKLELEKKELELKKEIDTRNKKLEDEQKKITEELENDFKIRYDRREEELETRLILEKDMAIEECEAKIQEKEKASTSIESVVNTMENELQCSICSELFIVSTTLNCAHTFCEYCIMEWRSVRDICPVCRQPIETVTRSLVLDNYIDKVLENLSGERREIRMKLIEERKQLAKKKMDSRNSGRSRRGSGRSQSRGRGNRVQNSGVHLSTRSSVQSNQNSHNPHYSETSVRQTRTPIVISSDEESYDSHDTIDDSDNDIFSDEPDGYPYQEYYDHRYAHEF